MKMSKKMISAMLAAAMCVSLTAPAWASGKEEITLDTVITEENMYDVFEYLDFTPEYIEKTDQVSTRQYTVRDLQYIISLCDSIPEDALNGIEIIAVPDETAEITPFATTGLKTLKVQDSTVDGAFFLGLLLEYTVTGEYYCNEGECYWTRATPGTISIKKNDTIYVIDLEILSMSAAAYGMGSYESSYIQLVSNYDLTLNIGFEGVNFPVHKFPVRGMTIKFYATDWL